jgi:hypothetical protein
MERAYRAVVIHPAGRVSRNQLVELLAARYPETKRSTLAQAVALLIADGHLINAGGQLIPGPVYHQPGEPEADQSLKGLVEYVDDSYGRNTSQPTML